MQTLHLFLKIFLLHLLIFTLEMAYQSDEIYLNEIDLTDENENNTTTKGSANVLNFIP